MVKLRKAYKKDRDLLLKLFHVGFKIYSLDLKSKNALKLFFDNLFNNIWIDDSQYIGYCLENENNEIVAFDGYIFSNRNINGKDYKFCSLTTWVVREDYKKYGLLVLRPLSELKKNYIIVNNTPNLAGFTVLTKMFQFKNLDSHRYLVPFFVSVKSLFSEISFLSKEEINVSELNNSDIFLFNYYLKSDILIFQLYRNKKKYLIFFKKIFKRGIPFLKLIYSSNLIYFSRDIYYIRHRICSYTNTLGISVDSRFINFDIKLSYKQKFNKLYLGEFDFKLSQIDNLFSEETIL
jgi:hypothetical protein